MRPITETTILITGATDGLGRAVAGRLAADGATLLLHGRNPDKLAAAADAIRAESGNDRITIFLADLASLDEVRALADEVLRSTSELHVLVSNAGVGMGISEGGERKVSEDGHELRFAVNHLAGFALTLRLLPLLLASAPSRIVNVASRGQSAIDFDDVMLESGYDGRRAYTQSKLAQIMSTFELDARLDGEPVTVTSLHPATFMPTNMLLTDGLEPIDTLEAGVEATLRLITSPDLEGTSGRHFDGQEDTRAHDQAYDEEARRRLWALSLALTGEPEPKLA